MRRWPFPPPSCCPRAAALPLALAAAIVAGSGASAEGPSLDLELELVSAYVFRGTLLNPDACLQPTVVGSAGAVSLEAWGSVNLTHAFGRAGEIGEVDLSLSVEGSLGDAALVAGINHYRYRTPEVGHTTELFAEIVVPWPVELRAGLAWDVDAAGAPYARLAAGLPVQLGERLLLDLELGSAWAGAGMNDFNFGVDRASLAEGDLGATLELELDAVTLWLRAGTSWLWRGDLERAAVDWYGEADPVFAGVGLSVRLTGP